MNFWKGVFAFLEGGPDPFPGIQIRIRIPGRGSLHFQKGVWTSFQEFKFEFEFLEGCLSIPGRRLCISGRGSGPSSRNLNSNLNSWEGVFAFLEGGPDPLPGIQIPGKRSFHSWKGVSTHFQEFNFESESQETPLVGGGNSRNSKSKLNSWKGGLCNSGMGPDPLPGIQIRI